MCGSLRLAVSQRQYTHKLFSLINNAFAFSLAECHSNPTSVKSKLLCLYCNSFPIVTKLFIKIWRFFSNQCNIIFYTAEFPVMSHETAECFRFFCNKLNMQSAFFIAFRNFRFNFINSVIRYGFIQIASDRVTISDCFINIHVNYSLLYLYFINHNHYNSKYSQNCSCSTI